MSKEAFDKVASPVVDAMLDAVLAAVRKELQEPKGVSGMHTPPQYNPERVALAITMGIAEAVPHIAQITKAYIANSTPEEL